MRKHHTAHFKTQVAEEVYVRDYASPKKLGSSYKIICSFYNHQGLHQALDYHPPASVYFVPRDPENAEVQLLDRGQGPGQEGAISLHRCFLTL